jgi:hypothetical protein
VLIAASTLNVPDSVGFLLAAILFLATLGAAWVVVKGGAGTRQIALDSTALANAQTQMQTQELRINDLERDLAAERALNAGLRGEVNVLRDVVTAKDVIIEGFVDAAGPRGEEVRAKLQLVASTSQTRQRNGWNTDRKAL